MKPGFGGVKNKYDLQSNRRSRTSRGGRATFGNTFGKVQACLGKKKENSRPFQNAIPLKKKLGGPTGLA